MLAIVIPYYKLTFFQETLHSLACQNDQRFTVYIGDDDSPENPTLLLEKFQGKFDFIYHRFENNLGSISLVKHWERCIALSKEEKWIMILGDDDQLEENVVAEFYIKYNDFANRSNVVRFATQVIDYKKSKVSEIFKHPKWEKPTDSYFDKSNGKTRGSLSEYIFLRTVYEKYKFHDYPLAWHSDDMAWIEFSENNPIYTISDTFIKIGISDISLSGIETNSDIKNSASLQFYNDIIGYNLHFFLKYQRLDLLYKYESLIKKRRKLSSKEWFMIFSLYCKNFTFLSFIKLIRRILISMIKN